MKVICPFCGKGYKKSGVRSHAARAHPDEPRIDDLGVLDVVGAEPPGPVDDPAVFEVFEESWEIRTEPEVEPEPIVVVEDHPLGLDRSSDISSRNHFEVFHESFEGLVDPRKPVVAVEHFAPPYRCAGSEMMMHRMLLGLRERGFEVMGVATEMPEAPAAWKHDEITYVSTRGVLSVLREAAPKVVLTHHQEAGPTIEACEQLGVPCVYVAHNDMRYTRRLLHQYRERMAGVVFNTEWVAARLRQMTRRAGMPSMVVRPPVDDGGPVNGGPGGAVSLINMNAHKGAEMFYRLAASFPGRRFIAQEGIHGGQVRRELPNVEWREHTDDLSGLWAETGVLLMPSAHESYGLTAVEAAVRGIPVVANPTAGLREALGSAGLWASRTVPRRWEAHLDALGDGWVSASERMLVRGEQVKEQRVVEADRFAVWLGEL